MTTNFHPDVLEALLGPIIERIVEEKIKLILEKFPVYTETVYTETEKPIKLHDMSDILGYSSSYLYRLTSKGLIPHHKISSGRVIFYQSEVNTWIRTKI